MYSKLSFKNGMLKALFLLLGCQLIPLADVGAQEYQRVHFGFVYPLSTNGREAPKVINSLSFHLLSGVSAGKKAALVSGIGSVVKGDQSGSGISGVFTVISGNSKGALVSGLVNYVGGSVEGAQIAGLSNYAKNIRGIQVSGLSSVSIQSATAQISGLVNYARATQLQIAGIASASDTSGVQVSGLVNTAKSVKQLQVAGLINVMDSGGVQVAGLVNVARKVRGAQVAGLVNIAEESDCPIGFLNLIKGGEKQIGLTLDESGNNILGFRTGGRVTYGVLGAGVNYKMNHAVYAMEVGLGLRIPVLKFVRLNIEGVNTINTDFDEYAYYKTSLRALLGVTFFKRIELVAGPSFSHVNYMSSQPQYVDQYLWKFYGKESVNALFVGGMMGVNVQL